ncbi:hypothetical protein DVH05_015013 [Phytophthora capsici]|nr:hypothetical protein DVH05_015013 [Phytophthora capsici]|eukprot:jgi/Phyca11/112192/e_gw1.21.161.1
MVKLFCAIVGAMESAISVEVGEGLTVGDLKKAIATDQKFDFAASKLQLFLTETEGGGWLSSEDDAAIAMRTGAIPEQVKKLLKDEIDPAEEIGDKFGSAPTKKTIHVLVVVPEGVTNVTAATVFENNRKRRREDDQPDFWMKAIEDDKVLTLPLTCEELKEHLQRELPVKIPLGGRLSQIVESQNVAGKMNSKLFDTEARHSVTDVTVAILNGVIAPVWIGGESPTEATYHFLWNEVIAKVLMYVSDGTCSRNSSVFTSTGLFRPNLCFYNSANDKVCVFRGEEQARGEMTVPLTDLQRLTWRYDDAPYVFGYAAVAQDVCLVTIRESETNAPGEKRRAKVEIIERYNLRDLRGRLSIFLALLNLSTLFRPVVGRIRPLGIAEYKTIIRPNGVKIAFGENCVVKTYPLTMPSDKIISDLRDLHWQMKENAVPNVVELKSTNMRKRSVELAPVGRQLPLENVHQLLMAMRDILRALVALHTIGLMHRDLRWENVLRYPDEDKWFLIDFDEGASSPAVKVDHLKAETHAPEILSSSTHTTMVDIWSVGYLLETSHVHDLPVALEDIKTQCLQENPSVRPTAQSLLEAVEALIAN